MIAAWHIGWKEHLFMYYTHFMKFYYRYFPYIFSERIMYYWFARAMLFIVIKYIIYISFFQKYNILKLSLHLCSQIWPKTDNRKSFIFHFIRPSRLQLRAESVGCLSGTSHLIYVKQVWNSIRRQLNSFPYESRRCPSTK